MTSGVNAIDSGVDLAEGGQPDPGDWRSVRSGILKLVGGDWVILIPTGE